MRRLSAGPLELEALRRAVRRPEAGAVTVFEGVVRNHHRGRRVDYLVYEAYEEMAEAMLEKICGQAREKFEVHAVEAMHRIGRLAVGETAVAVAVSASHRRPAFEACRWAMDEIKRLAPIWKREGNADGEEWVEPQS